MDVINIYAIVGPAVMVLILVEIGYCLYKKNGYYSYQDSLIGLGTMFIAQCVNVAVAVGVALVYSWVYENYALFEVKPTALNYVLCYIGVDFLFYWFHRAGHRVNILWAAHVPHHSAEELNYAVALRTSFTQRAASFLFYWPLAVLGFSPAIIIPVVALNLVIQLLPHTRVIPKLPSWIDSWLNTPYHHQIHHAANPIYWDKNYGGTFIFWDKWFGSYREQTEEPYYGVSMHPRSWDPTFLNLSWFLVLWNDARQATHFVDKVLVWFKPPGWRPRNLPPYEKGPAVTAATQVKYVTQPLAGSTPYLAFQCITAFAVLYLVIDGKSPLTTWEKVAVSALLWLAVTVWGGMLESKKWAKGLETIRLPLFYLLCIHLVQTHFSHVAWALPLATVYCAGSLVWMLGGVKFLQGMNASPESPQVRQA